MNKKKILDFVQEVIRNDEHLKKIVNDPIMFVIFTIIGTECIEAYQKALIAGVEFEAAKASED